MNVTPNSILVVEDNPLDMEWITGLLNKIGIAPICCTDGEEAVHAMEANDVKVAFVDLRLPKISGVQVIERSLKHRPNMKVVIVTGTIDSPQIASALQHKSVRVLTKPVSQRDLEDVLWQMDFSI